MNKIIILLALFLFSIGFPYQFGGETSSVKATGDTKRKNKYFRIFLLDSKDTNLES